MSIQKELRNWAKKVVEKYDSVAKEENTSYYTQSDMSNIKKNPKVLILGINPGSNGSYRKISPDVFLKGWNRKVAGK